jgi:transformation/transcription domain-associated protein
MISAITTVLADPYMDFCHAPTAALRLLIDTAMGLFDGDQAKVSRLPLLVDLLEQISLLCYRREWYARLGGCTALKLIVQHYPPVFVRQNAATFLNAFLEITSGLADEVSSGALDFASGSMDILLTVCFGSVGDKVEVKELSELFVSRLLEHLDDAEALVRNAVGSPSNSNVPIDNR